MKTKYRRLLKRAGIIAAVMMLSASPVLAQSTTTVFDFGTDTGRQTYTDAGFSVLAEDISATVNDLGSAARFFSPDRLTLGLQKLFSDLGPTQSESFSIEMELTVNDFPVENADASIHPQHRRLYGIWMFGAEGDRDSGFCARLYGESGAPDEVAFTDGFQTKITATATDMDPSLSGGNIAIDTTYTLTVDGTYSAPNLDVVFTVSDGSFSQTITNSFTEADFDGDVFGILGDTEGEVDVSYFSVTKTLLGADTTPPPYPTNVTVLAAREGMVDLEWDPVTEFDLAGYRVYRTFSDFTGSTPIAEVTNSTFSDSGLDPNTTYSYKITSFDITGNENDLVKVPVVQAKPSVDTTPPDAPTGLQAIPGDQSVVLMWDANTEYDLAGYNIYRSTTSGIEGTLINSTGLVTQTTYVDSSLIVNDQFYYYTVTAVDDAFMADEDDEPNESALSAEVEVQAGGDDVPEGLTKFGSAYDGSGDFTKAVELNTSLQWSDTVDSLQLTRPVEGGLNNSSALTQLDLDRSVGSEYQFTMVFSWDVGYAGNNNRFGIQMFADDSAVADDTEGIVAHWNVDKSQWTVGGGVNDYLYTTGAGGGPTASFNADEYTIDGTVSFLADDVLNAEFSIIAPDTTTYTTGGVFTASTMMGDWFGVVGRNRSTGGALEINVKSFRFVEVAATNEPGLTGYEAWADENNMGAPGEDDDGDGISNLREYALGATSTTEPTLPVFSKSGNAFTYVYPELAAADAGIVYTVQYTTNLVNGTWTDLPQGSVATGDPLNTVTVDVDTVEDEKFIRLKVEQQ